MDDGWAAALGGVVGLVGGGLGPSLLRALPPPDVDPQVVAALEQVAAGAGPDDPAVVEGLSRTQRAQVAEGPVETFGELAARRWLLPVTMATSAAAGALLGWALGFGWLLLLVLPLAPAGTLLAVVDWRTRLLPKRVVLPLTGAAVLYGAGAALLTGSPDALLRGLIGLAVLRSLFWLMWFLGGGALGFGDVRLAALVGFVLGYVGVEALQAWAIGFFAVVVLGTVPLLVLAAVRRSRAPLRAHVPYGPYILVATLIGIVAATW